ncbi:Fumarylacetoacetase [Nymphaea thermarum]|nr:Fumarylacetoacetase [Nymphaea thermarum]
MVMRSFEDVDPDSHFPLENLPFDVFKPADDKEGRPGVAIGNVVLDLSEIAAGGLFSGPILSGNSQCFFQCELKGLNCKFVVIKCSSQRNKSFIRERPFYISPGLPHDMKEKWMQSQQNLEGGEAAAKCKDQR